MDPSERQLIVLGRSDAIFGAAAPAISTAAPATLHHTAVAHPEIAAILRRHNARVRPLFAAGPHRQRPLAEAPQQGRASPARTYHHVLADAAELDEIADKLRKVDGVE